MSMKMGSQKETHYEPPNNPFFKHTLRHRHKQQRRREVPRTVKHCWLLWKSGVCMALTRCGRRSRTRYHRWSHLCRKLDSGSWDRLLIFCHLQRLLMGIYCSQSAKIRRVSPGGALGMWEKSMQNLFIWYPTWMGKNKKTTKQKKPTAIVVSVTEQSPDILKLNYIRNRLNIILIL